MPTASTHPGAAYSLIPELALTVLALFKRNRGTTPQYIPVNFSTRRVSIASAICLREHSVKDLDAYTPEVDAWLRLTALTDERRLLLIQAGIPVEQAVTAETEAWDDSTLRTLIALHRMAGK